MCVFVSFSFPFGLFPFIPFFSIQNFPSPFFYQVMLIIFFLVFSPSVHFTLPLIVFSHVFPSILSYYFFLFFPFFFHVKFYIYDVSFHSFFCYTYLLYSIVSILEFLHFNSFYYSFFLINSFVMSWFIFLYIFVRPS